MKPAPPQHTLNTPFLGHITQAGAAIVSIHHKPSQHRGGRGFTRAARKYPVVSFRLCIDALTGHDLSPPGSRRAYLLPPPLPW